MKNLGITSATAESQTR